MDAVDRFTALVTGRRRALELDRACLAIAAGAHRDVDADHWCRELDRLARGVDSLEGLVHRLFVEEGFTGDREGYYDPRNSLLPDVLSRRLGIPITLSVVCLEVGRRAGVALEGVGMPGHFLVRPVGTRHHLDAFDGGRMLDLADCEALFRASTRAGPRTPFRPELLATTPTPAILARVLQNLREVYRRLRRNADLEWVLRMRLVLPGAGPAELLELGRAMGEQGRWLEGARFLHSHAPQWPAHAETLQTAARALQAHLN